jgi:REP element-mobilizing transposase RayT
MANTYTQIHIQCVFAPKFRQALILPEWKTRLHQYITGIVQNHGHKMLFINSMPDHLHMYFGMRPDQSLSDLMRLVKGESSEWINNEKFMPSTFRWQEGFGGFSYTKSQVPLICNNIEKQEEHHKRRTFLEEYRNMLKEFEVDFNERYIFKLPE